MRPGNSNEAIFESAKTFASKHEIPINVIECEGAGSMRPKRIREITIKLEEYFFDASLGHRVDSSHGNLKHNFRKSVYFFAIERVLPCKFLQSFSDNPMIVPCLSI